MFETLPIKLPPYDDLGLPWTQGHKNYMNCCHWTAQSWELEVPTCIWNQWLIRVVAAPVIITYIRVSLLLMLLTLTVSIIAEYHIPVTHNWQHGEATHYMDMFPLTHYKHRPILSALYALHWIFSLLSILIFNHAIRPQIGEEASLTWMACLDGDIIKIAYTNDLYIEWKMIGDWWVMAQSFYLHPDT